MQYKFALPTGNNNWQLKYAGSLSPILWGLAAEAKKYDSPEEFERAFIGDIKHGMYWHITDNPNFFIDPQKGPRDMSSMSGGQETPGALMITSHLSHWAMNYAPVRKYAALIDMSNVPKETYQQVNRGFGNEFYVFHPESAQVAGVFSIKDAMRIDEEHHAELPGSSEELHRIWQLAQQTEIPPMDKQSLLEHFKMWTPDEWENNWQSEWSEEYEDWNRESSSFAWQYKYAQSQPGLQMFPISMIKFRAPLFEYLEEHFPEHHSSQKLMFNMNHDELMGALVKKILEIPVFAVHTDEWPAYPLAEFKLPNYTDEPAMNTRWDTQSRIVIEDINLNRYMKDTALGGYAAHVDSVLFHELVHAVNYEKQLWSDTDDDTNLQGGDYYYGDPEELRSQKAELDYLEKFLTPWRARQTIDRYDPDHANREWLDALQQGKIRPQYTASSGWQYKYGQQGEIFWHATIPRLQEQIDEGPLIPSRILEERTGVQNQGWNFEDSPSYGSGIYLSATAELAIYYANIRLRDEREAGDWWATSEDFYTRGENYSYIALYKVHVVDQSKLIPLQKTWGDRQEEERVYLGDIYPVPSNSAWYEGPIWVSRTRDFEKYEDRVQPDWPDIDASSGWQYKYGMAAGPLTVFHSTMAGGAIMSEGFKTSDELSGASLGGSGDSISFTTDWNVALAIHNGILIMHEFANSPDPFTLAQKYIADMPPEIYENMRKQEGTPQGFDAGVRGFKIGRWSDSDANGPLTEQQLAERGFEILPDTDPLTLQRDDKTVVQYYYWLKPMDENDRNYFFYNFVKYYLAFHPDLYDPLFFGSSLENFRGINREDIGIVTAVLHLDPEKQRDRNMGAPPGFDYLPAMAEIQLTDKSMITKIIGFESNPGPQPEVPNEPIAYHGDEEVEAKLNEILPILYENYEALADVVSEVSMVIMAFRKAKDMYSLIGIVGQLQKLIDRTMFSEAVRMRKLFEMDEDTKTGFDAQNPETQQEIKNAKTVDEVEDFIWRLMEDEDWYNRMSTIGVHPEDFRRDIVYWKERQLQYEPRYMKEFEVAKSWSKHITHENIMSLNAIGEGLAKAFPSGKYFSSNWQYKYGMFGNDKEIEVPIEATGYQEHWGEHHGPVRTKLDHWNYGPKGYNSDAMPLPKKLYHATPFPDKIIEQGIKSPRIISDELGEDRSKGSQTFGGGDEYFSLTTFSNAKRYADVIKDIIHIANGEFNHMSLDDASVIFAKKWGMDDEDRRSWLRQSEAELRYDASKGKRHDTAIGLINFYGYAHNYGPQDIPWLSGGGEHLLDRFQGMNPKDVGIVEIETMPIRWHSGSNIFSEENKMQGRYTYNPHENEWRFFDPRDVAHIQRVASSAWQHKFAQSRNKNNTFFLLDGKVIFFSVLHEFYLSRQFGLTQGEAAVLRFAIPRGRAIFSESKSGFFNKYGVFIEASPELEPYRQTIAKELGIRPQDRPRWTFDDTHYNVNPQSSQLLLEKGQFSPAAEEFVRKYIPGLSTMADSNWQHKFAQTDFFSQGNLTMHSFNPEACPSCGQNGKEIAERYFECQNMMDCPLASSGGGWQPSPEGTGIRINDREFNLSTDIGELIQWASQYKRQAGTPDAQEGEEGVIVNSQHKQNNGKRVRIKSVSEDEYIAESIDPSDTRLYFLKPGNFQRIAQMVGKDSTDVSFHPPDERQAKTIGWQHKYGQTTNHPYGIDWNDLRDYMTKQGYENDSSFQDSIEWAMQQSNEPINENVDKTVIEANAYDDTWGNTEIYFYGSSEEIQNKLVEGQPYPIFRVITALSPQKINLDEIGVYWSHDEDAAEAHWGYVSAGHRQYLIKGLVDIDYINWLETYALNANISQRDEKEVRLIGGSPVYIQSITDLSDNSEIEINQTAKALEASASGC